MGFQTAKPSPLLAPFVHQYWEIGSVIPSGQTHIQRIIPSGLMELMHYQYDLPTVIQETYEIPGSSFLSGQQKGYYDLSVKGKLSLFSVQFKAFGAYAIFDIPMHEFVERNIPLELFVTNQIQDIEDKLCGAGSFSEKCIIIEHFLTKLLTRRQKIYTLKRIMHCISVVNKQKGIVSIDHLADTACLGRKQLERNFKDFIGISPRQFLKVIRFQNSLHQKSIDKEQSLTVLAHECGYFDQSHMINDYRELSGMTPGEYFDVCEPVSDYFTLNV